MTIFRLFNPFVPNVPFLYPLKTLENLTAFWCFQGVEKGCIGNKLVKQESLYMWMCGIIYTSRHKSIAYCVRKIMMKGMVLWLYGFHVMANFCIFANKIFAFVNKCDDFFLSIFLLTLRYKVYPFPCFPKSQWRQLSNRLLWRFNQIERSNLTDNHGMLRKLNIVHQIIPEFSIKLPFSDRKEENRN